MPCIEGRAREQQVLFPEVLDDYVSAENPVRFLDAFVDSLDLAAHGFRHATPRETGRPPYDPADLLRLYLYGYLNRVRSSRKLEQETHRNIEVIWLLRKLRPDFKTIADFRKDHPAALKGVCRDFTGGSALHRAGLVTYRRIGELGDGAHVRFEGTIGVATELEVLRQALAERCHGSSRKQGERGSDSAPRHCSIELNFHR